MVEDSTWTVVPVQPSSALAHSTVQFSPSSLALQSFAEALQKVAPSKISSHSRSGIEIRVLDVIPLPLETVFVTIEGDLARRLENGEGTFHGEHVRTNGHFKGKSPAAPEDRLTSAIREALSALKVAHTNDFFSLPLPPHWLSSFSAVESASLRRSYASAPHSSACASGRWEEAEAVSVPPLPRLTQRASSPSPLPVLLLP